MWFKLYFAGVSVSNEEMILCIPREIVLVSHQVLLLRLDFHVHLPMRFAHFLRFSDKLRRTVPPNLPGLFYVNVHRNPYFSSVSPCTTRQFNL